MEKSRVMSSVFIVFFKKDILTCLFTFSTDLEMTSEGEARCWDRNEKTRELPPSRKLERKLIVWTRRCQYKNAIDPDLWVQSTDQVWQRLRLKCFFLASLFSAFWMDTSQALVDDIAKKRSSLKLRKDKVFLLCPMLKLGKHVTLCSHNMIVMCVAVMDQRRPVKLTRTQAMRNVMNTTSKLTQWTLWLAT